MPARIARPSCFVLFPAIGFALQISSVVQDPFDDYAREHQEPVNASDASNASNASSNGSQYTLNLCMEDHFVPELILLGAQKSATTILGQELKLSQQIVSPMLFENLTEKDYFSKELHIFDKAERYGRGQGFWLSHYPYCQHENRTVAVDFTPNYIAHPNALANMRMWYPLGQMRDRLQFVLLLREPLARMQSAFYHYRATGDMLDIMANGTFGMYVRHVMEVVGDDDDVDRWLVAAESWEDPFGGSLYVQQLTRFFSNFEAAKHGKQLTVVPMRYLVEEHRGGAPWKVTVANYVLGKLSLDVVDHPQRLALEPPARNHPVLKNDLGGQYTKARKFVKKHIGADLVAAVFTQNRGADLYGYLGESFDVKAMATWLDKHW